MNPPRAEGFVRMPDAEFEAILTRAAEEGARMITTGVMLALLAGVAIKLKYPFWSR
jgi:hypothetical protein